MCEALKEMMEDATNEGIKQGMQQIFNQILQNIKGAAVLTIVSTAAPSFLYRLRTC